MARNFARSTWQAATVATSGAKRIPAVIGAGSTVAAIAQAIIVGHTSVLWWVIAALWCFLIAVVWAYHDLRMENDRLRAAVDAVDDSWKRLEAQLTKVGSLRTWLTLLENPDESMPLERDRLFGWAKDTFGLLLRTKSREAADAFMGKDDYPNGDGYFVVAYVTYCAAHGRRNYLESRREIVQSLFP